MSFTCCLVAGYNYGSLHANIGWAKIWKSNEQKLLRVSIDNSLSFDEHVSNLCKKGWSKVICFSKILKLYQPKASCILDESFHRGPIWLLLVNLDVFWEIIE